MTTFLVIWGMLDIIAIILLRVVEDEDYWSDIFAIFYQRFFKALADMIILLALFPLTIPNSAKQIIKNIKK